MPLKTIEIEDKTYAEIGDGGHPIYVVDGKELEFNGEKLYGEVGKASRENEGIKEKLSQSEAKLASFAKIEDPEKAVKALSIVANLDESKLVEAGKVEEVKQVAIKSVEDQLLPKLEEVTKDRDQLRSDLHREMIGGRFLRSKYISEKLAIPPELVESHFGERFSIEDGRVVARNSKGEVIVTKDQNVPYGIPAKFDEALSVMVDESPFKDSLLKGRGVQGTGSTGSGKPGAGGSRTMLRSEFDKLAVSDPARARKLMLEDQVTLVDE